MKKIFYFFIESTDFDSSCHRPDLNITLERMGFSSLRVSWKQLGQFNHYLISRYIIQVAADQQPMLEYFDKSNLNSSILIY